MTCDGCGNKGAIRLRFTGRGECSCDHCGGLGALHVPDVYFKEPYYDYNLAHPNRPWEAKRGAWVSSRRHKAALLAEQGLVEKGDKRGGMRLEDRFLQQRAREQGF